LGIDEEQAASCDDRGQHTGTIITESLADFRNALNQVVIGDCYSPSRSLLWS
jgi:hypothetical protein